MDSYKTYKGLIDKWVRINGQLMGIDILQDGYKVGIHAIVMISFKFMALASYFWTMYAYDMDTALKSVGHFGVCLQAIVKSVLTLYYRKDIQKSMQFIDKVYEQNAKSHENKLLVEGFLELFSLVIKTFLFVYIACESSFFFSPILMYTFKGVLEGVLPTFIPGVDFQTSEGYTLNTIYHILVVIATGGLANFSDGIFVVQVFHTILLFLILRKKINDLNEMAAVPKASPLALKLNFRNILILHNEMVSYVRELGRIYTYTILCVLFLAIQNVVLHIFIAFMFKWIPIAAMFVILSETGAMFNFCAIGTIFEVVFDKLFDEIQFLKWYVLPKPCHKDMVMMFNLAEKPVRLTILDILPLNMDTFVIIVKRIYALIMLLNSFL